MDAERIPQRRAEDGWKAEPKRVTASYAKLKRIRRIRSTTGHEESGGKEGGPSPKAKYDLVTDRV